MRAALLIVVASLICTPVYAQAPFTGVWNVDICDPGVPTSKCRGFTLWLLQTGANVCGAHLVRDTGGVPFDVGQPISVTGQVRGTDLFGAVTSGRTTKTYPIEARLSHGVLLWKVAETSASLQEGFRPEKIILTRVASDDALAKLRVDCAKALKDK